MDNAAAYQSQIIARQLTSGSAHAAREYTRRNPAPTTQDGAARRHLRVSWPHPVRAAAHT